ncbi:MAG: alpha amylase family protein [Paludibacter sp.]|nr:alpha amylase family protein [Paludibacter sp.]
MKKLSIFFSIFLVINLFSSCNEGNQPLPEWEWNDTIAKLLPVNQKPRILWIDAAANFKYFANSQENILFYLQKAKNTGFTELVVDVRGTSGDVLYASKIVNQITKLGETERTATWDYLGAFIEIGHSLGFKVHANINTFVGGNTSNSGSGVVYRDAAKAQLLTTMYLPGAQGLTSIMNDGSSNAKFFNPIHPDVQNYILSIISELAINYSLDGIVLDRCRFNSIESDFSAYTRDKFESYIGKKLTTFPDDIYKWNTTVNANGTYSRVEGLYYKLWLEFRAKVIHDFVEKSRTTIKAINKNIQLGAYTGSWYSTYYNEGVNWASPKYDPSKKYSWATPNYKNFGYADMLDFYMTGAYGKTIYGAGEWTVQGALELAQEVTKGDVPVSGSLYGLNFQNAPQDCEEAVYVCLTQSNGLMFFDIIYLIMYDQWNNVKVGIDRALATKK